MDLLEPWYVPADLSRLDAQLAKEISPGHVLEQLPVRALAQRQDRDDVLFELLDGTHRVTIVHLTYSQNTDPNWPHSKIYSSLADWLERPMREDHAEFAA